MVQEESGLFQVRFTEEGKRYIRRFAAMSYFLLVLVFLECGVTIYWNVKSLLANTTLGSYGAGGSRRLYFKVLPYSFIVSSILAIAANLHYLRFPRILLRCIELNDEAGANKAFQTLFKGAFIFLLWLLIITGMIIWGFTFGMFF